MEKPSDFYCNFAISGKADIKKVYESDKVIAFHHTHPAYEKHIVIVPKEHITDLIALKESHNETLLEIVEVAKKLANEFNLEKEGVRLITNMGIYQDSKHLHFHLVSGERMK